MFLASSRALTWLPPAPPQSMLVRREKRVWACAGAKPCAKDPKLAGPVAWVVCGVARTPPVTHIGTGYLAVLFDQLRDLFRGFRVVERISHHLELEDSASKTIQSAAQLHISLHR